MSKHTPGPWTVGIMTETGLPGVMQLDGPVIAEITKWTSVGRSDPDVIQGNARLIAEAPELYRLGIVIYDLLIKYVQGDAYEHDIRTLGEVLDRIEAASE